MSITVPVEVNNAIVGEARIASNETIVIFLNETLPFEVMDAIRNGFVTSLQLGVAYMPAKPTAIGVNPPELKKNSPLVLEHDRNARAYGYEVGKGAPLAKVVNVTTDNPFMDPNWAEKLDG